jgi:hypothetical protein
MGTPVQTFWLERTGQVAVGLRRYHSAGGGFSCAEGYHSALVYVGVEDAAYDDSHGRSHLAARPKVAHDDPRWPAQCDKGCGYVFTPDDAWQDWQELLYRRTDTGEVRVLHQGAPAPEAPSAEPGATWDAWWMPYSRGDDGLCLVVRCPDGHDWMVDSRASNCTLPDDNDHHCWVRHGDPRDCRVTVDKNGRTCAAGAGSIQTPQWHGFLRDGQLVT